MVEKTEMKDVNETEKQSVKKQIAGPDLNTKPVRALPKIFSNPFYVIIVTVISLFLAETFVMIILSNLPALPLYERALIDALLLVIVAFPAFYLFLFKPIRSCIAEYRLTEESLLREKDLSEMVINSLPGVFYLFDHEGEPWKWNRNAEIITGYSAEEIKRMKQVDFFEGEDIKLIAEKTREVFDKGESYAEADLVSKSGKKTRYYFNGHRLIMDNKQYLAGMGIDVSELKKTEEAVLKVRREWENIFQAIGQPTIILDPEHNILSANRATVTAAGLSKEDVVGKKCYEIFHGTSRPPDSCPLEKMLHSGKLETEAMELEALGGVYLVSCTPVLDDEGRLQKVIHIATDITERKRIENIVNIQRDLGIALSGERDFKGALSLLLDTATKLDGMDCGGIYTFEPAFTRLELAVSKGLSPEFVERVSHYSRDTDNVRLVMAGKPVYVKYSELEIPMSGAERREGLLSIAIIPIIYRDHLVACMNIASHTLMDIPVITRNTLETIASQIGSAIVRLKAEEALQKSHSLLTSLVESPSDIIILSLDKDYNYTFFNDVHKKEMKKVWGVDIEIGRNLIGYIRSEEERDRVRNNFERVLNGESFTKTECYGAPENRFCYELAYNPIYDEANNANGITVFIKDITERKKAEEAVLNIATGVSATVGKKFFYSIAEHLAKILKADFAYVAEIIKEAPNAVRTLALYSDGKFIDNIEVDLAGTPCETAKENICSYPSGVQKLFPRAEMMARMNVEGYIGTPLFGSNGEWLGLMSIMYREPIKNVPVARSMLQIFATRAAAELERKQAEEALKIKDRAIDSSINAIVIVDPEANIIYINPAFIKLWGYDNDKEVLGRTTYEFFSDEEKVIDVIKILNEKNSWTGELVARKKDGTFFDAQLSTNLVKDDSGRPICMMGSVLDITERKKFEKALGNSEKRFKMLAEESPNMIFINKKGRVVYTNKKCEEIMGYSREEYYSDEFNFLDVIAPEYVDLIKENFKIHMSGREVLPYDYKLITKDGRELVAIITTKLIAFEGENAILGIITDITERKRAEDDLAKAKKQIEAWNRELEERVKEKTEELVSSQAQLVQSEKVSAMGRMAGGLAHELNSPLAGLLPLIEKYQRKAKKGSEAYTELTLMFKAAEHMAKIIKDFGAFSRESKGVFLRLDLKQVIEDTLSFSAVSLRQRGIRIIKKYERRLPEVQGEKTELQQVVLNMIANACDAMPEGGKFIIKTGLANDGSNVIIEFIDNGVGIEKENLGRIFDPFYTTKKAGEGTGLGLSITYGIIKKHNGEISVESKPGKGTKFKIILPAVKAHEM